MADQQQHQRDTDVPADLGRQRTAEHTSRPGATAADVAGNDAPKGTAAHEKQRSGPAPQNPVGDAGDLVDRDLD